MSDSDATKSPESEETLPPDSPERACHTPDLFGDSDSNDGTSKEKNLQKSSMNKRRSQVHEISDSESDYDNAHLSKVNRNDDKHDQRKQFINDFLQMSASDSDDDSILLSHQKKKKNTSLSKIKHINGSSAKDVKDYATNKPYKQNFSKPFLSDIADKKVPSSPKKSNSVNDKAYKEKATSSMQSPSKSLKKSLSSSSPKSNSHRHEGGTMKKHKSEPSSLKKVEVLNTSKYEAGRSDKVVSHKLQEGGSTINRHQTEPKQSKHDVGRKSGVPHDLQNAVTQILNESNNAKRKKKPQCQYGAKCYRKNPAHFEEYSHNSDSEEEESSTPQKKAKISSSPQTSTSKPSTSQRSSTPSTSGSQSGSRPQKRSGSEFKTPNSVREKLAQAQPYNFFLTHVVGIKGQHNSSYVLDIKEILSAEMGNLVASCQFNFMFDIGWLIRQYPAQFRSKPILIVHGEKGASMTNLQAQAMSHSNIRFCQAKLDIAYGTHHTKMMLLLYDTGMRVVIHTANLIENDWHQKTQGIWVSPLFPPLKAAGPDKGDSVSHFKHDLIEYITAYRAYQLKEWIEHISKHDMSAAKVVIVGSVPGRHQGQKVMASWGHCKLKSALQKHGPSLSLVKSWPVIGQFSSIGSLGPTKEGWLCSEWLQSLSATKTGGGPQATTRLQLIFPSKDNVRLSLEGFPAGGSIPYSVNTAKKQPYLHNFFHVWKSEGRGRSRAMPHIKTYMRPVQDGTRAAWFCCTSSNLSKAAWGAFEKQGTQLMIRSYEIGVLFLPEFFHPGEESFPISSDPCKAWSNNALAIPYDLPPQIYEKKDRPWMWDIPYTDLPDTNGNIWCPFSK